MNQKDFLFFQRLSKPEGKIDVVLDTDTYNEIDDQFALAYMLYRKDRINLNGEKLSGNPPYSETDGKRRICRAGVPGLHGMAF